MHPSDKNSTGYKMQNWVNCRLFPFEQANSSFLPQHNWQHLHPVAGQQSETGEKQRKVPLVSIKAALQQQQQQLQ